jgi:hypothetical protein
MTDRRYIVDDIVDTDTSIIEYRVIDSATDMVIEDGIASRERADAIADAEEARFDADIADRS